MELIGIECRVRELPEDISQREFEKEFQKINQDPSVHGILLFHPLPDHLDEKPVKSIIHPYKDVDCMSDVNIAKVFAGDETGFAPCTAEAVVRMLDHYGIDPKGRKVTVVGRSMVVGKPLAMLLLDRHGTVTLCHTRTADLEEECRKAQILVAAAGKAGMITEAMTGQDAVVVDVGINVDENGRLCGDVDFDAVEPRASYISPVPRRCGKRDYLSTGGACASGSPLSEFDIRLMRWRRNIMRESARIFLRAVAAGIAIAIGGTVYLSVENKIAGSLFFTVGLYAIVLNGLNLYTGRIGYLVEQKEKRSYIWLLFLTWLGNLAGTSLAAVCLFCSKDFIFD